MARILQPVANYATLQFLINGNWVDSESQEKQGAFNPALGKVIAEVPFGLDEEVTRAVDAAAEAFEGWRNVPVPERLEYLFRMREALERHFEELSTIITQNHGKTIEESEGEMRRTIENVDVAISVAYTPAKGNTLLNFCGIDRTMLDFIVDRSSLKHGLLTPGTHIPIEPPEHLLASDVRDTLLLAWNFGDEILRQQDAYRSRGGRFIVPIPTPVVV